MPFPTRFVRLVSHGTLPETRGLILRAARSGHLHESARRAIRGRAAIARDLGDRRKAQALVRHAALHPATQELVATGLLFLPGRYLPLGWVATWAARKALRRYLEPPSPRDGEPARPSIVSSSRETQLEGKRTGLLP